MENREWTVVARNKGKTGGKTSLTKNLNPRAAAPARPRALDKYSVFLPRAPLTPEQKQEQEALLRRQLFIKTEGDSLQKMARTKPLQLKKSVEEAAGGPVEGIKRMPDGLHLTFSTEERKKMAMKMAVVAGQRTEVSEPRALTRPTKPQQPQNEADYEVKGVIFGLEEEEENLPEIAAEINVRKLCEKDGRPKFTNESRHCRLPERAHAACIRNYMRAALSGTNVYPSPQTLHKLPGFRAPGEGLPQPSQCCS